MADSPRAARWRAAGHAKANPGRQTADYPAFRGLLSCRCPPVAPGASGCQRSCSPPGTWGMRASSPNAAAYTSVAPRQTSGRRGRSQAGSPPPDTDSSSCGWADRPPDASARAPGADRCATVRRRATPDRRRREPTRSTAHRPGPAPADAAHRPRTTRCRVRAPSPPTPWASLTPRQPRPDRHRAHPARRGWPPAGCARGTPEDGAHHAAAALGDPPQRCPAGGRSDPGGPRTASGRRPRPANAAGRAPDAPTTRCASQPATASSHSAGDCRAAMPCQRWRLHPARPRSRRRRGRGEQGSGDSQASAPPPPAARRCATRPVRGGDPGCWGPRRAGWPDGGRAARPPAARWRAPRPARAGDSVHRPARGACASPRDPSARRHAGAGSSRSRLGHPMMGQ